MRTLAILALTACGHPGSQPAPPPPVVADSAPHPIAMVDAAPAVPPVDAAPPSCVDDGKPFAEAALRERIAFLASPDLDGRAPGTAGDTAARAFIVERMRCLGLSPVEQPFEADGAKTANVVGIVPGGDAAQEIIVIGAHHDHLGNKHVGANDNASGVVALLAVAQAVRQHGTPKRTIAFVTWGGEELGLLGSQYFVDHPPANVPLDRVVQYINLDMVGSHKSQDAVAAFGAFAGQPSQKLLARLVRGYPKLHVGIGGHSVRGDQVGFCKNKIPYVFFWTPDDRCYHQTCDTADAIDYPRMVDIASLTADLVLGLAEGDTDLAAARAKTGCGR